MQRRVVTIAVLATALICVGTACALREAMRPPIAEPTAAMLEHSRRVRILRDARGVPHIFGERDVDTAFGLAYAQAEDDYPTVQTSLAAARGNLALLMLNET